MIILKALPLKGKDLCLRNVGLKSVIVDGLRNAICRRIAEVEGDVFRVMAVSGHTDIKEAQKYCDRFNRKGKADSAIGALPGGEERTKLDEPAGKVRR